MKSLILLFICLFLVGCSASSTKIQSTSIYPDLEIIMERDPCFGTCPYYILTIRGNGTVYYEGRVFVKVEGTQSTKISSEKIQELVTSIENADFFSLKEQYGFSTTDLPSITLSITLEERSKSTRHYGSLDCSGQFDKAPQKLCELESKIDEVAISSQWIT